MLVLGSIMSRLLIYVRFTPRFIVSQTIFNHFNQSKTVHFTLGYSSEAYIHLNNNNLDLYRSLLLRIVTKRSINSSRL